jgi:hypothetical protein
MADAAVPPSRVRIQVPGICPILRAAAFLELRSWDSSRAPFEVQLNSKVELSGPSLMEERLRKAAFLPGGLPIRRQRAEARRAGVENPWCP